MLSILLIFLLSSVYGLDNCPCNDDTCQLGKIKCRLSPTSFACVNSEAICLGIGGTPICEKRVCSSPPTKSPSPATTTSSPTIDFPLCPCYECLVGEVKCVDAPCSGIACPNPFPPSCHPLIDNDPVLTCGSRVPVCQGRECAPVPPPTPHPTTTLPDCDCDVCNTDNKPYLCSNGICAEFRHTCDIGSFFPVCEYRGDTCDPTTSPTPNPTLSPTLSPSVNNIGECPCGDDKCPVGEYYCWDGDYETSPDKSCRTNPSNCPASKICRIEDSCDNTPLCSRVDISYYVKGCAWWNLHDLPGSCDNKIVSYYPGYPIPNPICPTPSLYSQYGYCINDCEFKEMVDMTLTDFINNIPWCPSENHFVNDACATYPPLSVICMYMDTYIPGWVIVPASSPDISAPLVNTLNCIDNSKSSCICPGGLTPLPTYTLPPSLDPQTPQPNPTKPPTIIIDTTISPTNVPSPKPTYFPSTSPSSSPTYSPSRNPTKNPSKSPSSSPSMSPSKPPTKSPSGSPTSSPTKSPTKYPTLSPSRNPTRPPSSSPSKSPTGSPSGSPTKSPTGSPTKSPTGSPSYEPSRSPSDQPTKSPTNSPSKSPSKTPTSSPSSSPSGSPTSSPSSSPSGTPTGSPTKYPSKSPTISPSDSPTLIPTLSPLTFIDCMRQCRVDRKLGLLSRQEYVLCVKDCVDDKEWSKDDSDDNWESKD